MKVLNNIYIIIVVSVLAVVSSDTVQAQNIDFNKQSTLGNLYVRMYGELHYYQPVGGDIIENGTFDAKRVVTLFGYQFNKNTQFISEIEFEHANEVFLEQAFIKHKIAGNTSIKAGMILIPMGIVNEQHEPNNFYSVDRPVLDRVLVPTTWRDIGFGITGIMPERDIKYQAYLVNGLISHKDDDALFKGANPYRSGRQKGIKGVLSGLPAFSSQIEYYGFENGKIGLSWYSGYSNSDAYQGVNRNDEVAMAGADSTRVYSNMLGLHTVYKVKSLSIRGQAIYSMNTNVDAYNEKGQTDLSKSSFGTYLELGAPISSDEKWSIFTRYSFIDTILDEDENESNQGMQNVVTAGINFTPVQGAVFKLDGQWSSAWSNKSLQINAGVGFWF